MIVQRIIPHLWFDTLAKEAAEYYVNLFEDSRIISTDILQDTPSGSTETVSFQLAGMNFQAISGGDKFHFNPSLSFIFYSKSKKEIKKLWTAFSDGGRVLMDLDRHKFSDLYGWIEDKYGLSWQLQHIDRAPNQRINPALMFSDGECGRAEEAINYYLEVFKNSKIDTLEYYEDDQAMVEEAKVSYAEFTLDGVELIAMDHGAGGDYSFNEAFSLIVLCEDQEEIDYYWDKLSKDPHAGECGWTKDKFGLSWQILPAGFDQMLADGNHKQVKNLMETFLKMKKVDLKQLKEAYENEK